MFRRNVPECADDIMVHPDGHWQSCSFGMWIVVRACILHAGLCECMCVCVFVRVCVSLGVCVCVCLSGSLCNWLIPYVCLHLGVTLYLCWSVYLYVCVWVCVAGSVCISIVYTAMHCRLIFRNAVTHQCHPYQPSCSCMTSLCTHSVTLSHAD